MVTHAHRVAARFFSFTHSRSEPGEVFCQSASSPQRERERESKGERECRRSRPSQWEGKRFSRIAASSAGCGRMEPKTGEHLLGEVIKRMQQFL